MIKCKRGSMQHFKVFLCKFHDCRLGKVRLNLYSNLTKLTLNDFPKLSNQVLNQGKAQNIALFRRGKQNYVSTMYAWYVAITLFKNKRLYCVPLPNTKQYTGMHHADCRTSIDIFVHAAPIIYYIYLAVYNYYVIRCGFVSFQVWTICMVSNIILKVLCIFFKVL